MGLMHLSQVTATLFDQAGIQLL